MKETSLPPCNFLRLCEDAIACSARTGSQSSWTGWSQMNGEMKAAHKHLSHNDEQKEGDQHHHPSQPPGPPKLPHLKGKPTWRYSQILSWEIHRTIHQLDLHLRMHPQRPQAQRNTNHMPTPPLIKIQIPHCKNEEETGTMENSSGRPHRHIRHR